MSIDDLTEDEAVEQVLEVHRVIADRLDAVWDGVERINEIEGGYACLGTMTALLHKAIFIQTFWAACQSLELAGFRGGKDNVPDDLREQFVRLAGDCWDDVNGEVVDAE